MTEREGGEVIAWEFDAVCVLQSDVRLEGGGGASLGGL